MSSSDHKVRRIASLLVFALLLGALTDHALARGRSFPVEITGTITRFDRATQTFTIQVDEPAGILTIGIGRDCKFKQNGAPTGEQILKQGARVKVSYFSTIFTGKIAVGIESNPVPEVKSGVTEMVDLAEREFRIRLNNSLRQVALCWAKNARFLRGGKTVSAKELKPNMPIRVSYYSPAFAKKYAIQIELDPTF
jgi:hypothetical protein